MKIMPNRMDRGFYQYQQEFEDKALEVLRSGWYVLGKEVKAFEQEFAAYTGGGYCIGLASGLDALWIEMCIRDSPYSGPLWGYCGTGCIPVL